MLLMVIEFDNCKEVEYLYVLVIELKLDKVIVNGIYD